MARMMMGIFLVQLVVITLKIESVKLKLSRSLRISTIISLLNEFTETEEEVELILCRAAK